MEVTTSTLLVNLLLSHFGDTEEKRKILLANSGISSTQLKKRRGRISAKSDLIVVTNVSKLKGDDWVWRYTDMWKSAPTGLLGKAFLNAPTYGESLGILARFGYLWTGNMYFELFTENTAQGKFRMLSVDIVPEGPETLTGEINLKHCLMIYVQNMLKQILDSHSKGVELRIVDTPKVARSVYERPFSFPVKLNQKRFGFAMPEKLFNQENPNANAAQFKKAMYLLNQLSGPQKVKDEFVLKVQNYLSISRDGRPNAKDASKWLGVSQRTLNRRLNEGETSFRILLETSLENRAIRLLQANTLSRADIAERLGYKDQASFSRALKRWKTNG